jgi:hypothetical protein
MPGLGPLLRMSRWARHPPGWARVRLVLLVAGACLLLFLVERLAGWPDWLTPNGTPRGRIN